MTNIIFFSNMGDTNKCSFNFIFYLSIEISVITNININSDFIATYENSTLGIYNVTDANLTIENYTF